jgi:beta-N-acetylhexosaminidase
VPFKAAIQAHVAGIMSAHVSFPAIETLIPELPATLSPRVMTGLVRDELHFDGLLATDSLDMGALGQSGFPIARSAAMALQAGADVLLFNRDHVVHQQAFQLISEWIRDGKIPLARLDEAVLRMLRAKQQYGILEPQLADPDAAARTIGGEAARSVAREAALRSVTLVKDVNGLLPLKADTRLLVVETSASAGLGKALNATAVQLREPPTSSEIDVIVGNAAGRTVIVGTTDANRSQGQASLVKALLKAKIPTIVIAMRGPYDLLAFPEAPVYLATYGAPPPTLAALQEILNGTARPQGKLPVEIPQLYAIGAGIVP